MIKWKGPNYRRPTTTTTTTADEDTKCQVTNHPDNPDNDLDVGRIVDFDVERDIVYIQNTFRCGTLDDAEEDIVKVENWDAWVAATDAVFVNHSSIFQLKQTVLYWWDRPGCGSGTFTITLNFRTSLLSTISPLNC